MQAKNRRGSCIRDLESFNKVLVGKWIWRLLDEPKNLWAQVIHSKYGSFEGSRDLVRQGKGRAKASCWWIDICRLYWGSNADGLRRDFTKRLGNGADTNFWHDRWIGNETLCTQFPRLFRLSSQKHCMISEMGFWLNSKWEWDLRWTRTIANRLEAQLQHLLSIIGPISVSAAGTDTWHWSPAKNGVYTTAAAYDFLRRRSPVSVPQPNSLRLTFKRLWSTWSPRKTIPCAWKLFNGRLSTLVNLSRRGVQLNSTLCPLCKEIDESEEHLFFRCKSSSQIWAGFFKMVGNQFYYAYLPFHKFLAFLGFFW